MSQRSELLVPWMFAVPAALGLLGCSIDDRLPATASSTLGPAGVSMASAGTGVVIDPAPPGSNAGAGGARGADTIGTGTLGTGMSGGDTIGMGSDGVPSEVLPVLPAGAGAGGSAAGSDVGAAGSGSDVGAAGSGSSVTAGPAPCTGCVELVVPVTGPDQSASFRFFFAQPADFSHGMVSWRVQVPEADTNTDFYLTTDVQISRGPGIFENYTVLSPYNFSPGEWLDLSVDVSAHPPLPVAPGAAVGFDYRAVQLVVLTLGTTSEFSSTDTIRVLVDSVTFSGVPGVSSREFSTGTEGLGLAAGAPASTPEPIHHR